MERRHTDGIASDEENHTAVIAQPGLRLRLRNETLRLSTQHRQLNTFFEMVVADLGRGSLQRARASFVRFRDALEAHLTLEDQVFFPAMRGLRPELAEPLTRLVEDHTRFRAELETLHELLATGSAEAFASQFDDLAGRVAKHERYEEEVLSSAAG
jgi:iron-sulfur cluster repair protein YtfE (RIC family)